MTAPEVGRWQQQFPPHFRPGRRSGQPARHFMFPLGSTSPIDPRDEGHADRLERLAEELRKLSPEERGRLIAMLGEEA